MSSFGAPFLKKKMHIFVETPCKVRDNFKTTKKRIKFNNLADSLNEIYCHWGKNI